MLAGLLIGALVAAVGAEHEQARPNVVLIMSDDQGQGDFSHAGHGVLETPHLDRLAAQSPRIERFYVSPVCSPTRASLLTGRYNYRTRVVDTWIGRSMMDPDELTIAEILSTAGYATGIFGKWHLGDCYPLRPMDQGFERSLVHRGGGLAQPSEPPENDRRYTDPVLLRNGEQVETEGYCTDVYFDAALEFIDASRIAERPFFAYVATNAPHDPFHDVPEELYAKYRERDLAPTLRGKSDDVDREARICAMVENIDRNVGRLLALLEQRGLANDTIVVYLNDNGPVGGRFTRGLRGQKAGVYEGGVRAPLFVRWPGELDPETTVQRTAAHIDLLPTLLDMLEIAVPATAELDGRSLLPLLRGEELEWPARRIFLQSHRGNAPARAHHFAVVGQRWKLVRSSGFGRHAAPQDHPFELFDLLADPFEQRDLAAANPAIVAELRRAYDAWFDDVSTTRPHNFDPPRIVVGSPAEPTTVLTRQDRRSPQGEGWGNDGAWWLAATEPFSAELALLFVEETSFDRARVTIGPETRELSGNWTGARVPLGAFELPSGRWELAVELFAGEESVGVHQLTVARLPSASPTARDR